MKMTTSPLANQHAPVLAVLAQHPNGCTLAQILAGLDAPPSKRSVQRWLLGLAQQGLVRTQGVGKATRYAAGGGFVAHSTASADAPTAEPAPEPSPEPTSASPITLSQQAQAALRHVQQPLQKRTPVGYHSAFLNDYQPNASFYLPAATRAALMACGQAVQANEPAGTYARQIASRLLIDLSWNSSRLEGNTYSLLETERLLEAGHAANGKTTQDGQMILNHKEAIEFLISNASEIGFNRYTLLNLHALLSDNLLADPTASGRLRSIAVGIGHTVFMPLEGPQRIEAHFQQILDTASAIVDPFEQAFFAMVHLPYLQPFEDVNKRVSRLAANIPLIARNLCPLSFVDVPQPIYISALLGVYELNRIELLREVFVWAYQRSCARYSAVRQSLGEPDPFRVQYRAQLLACVSEVVRTGLSKAAAVTFVHQFSQQQLPAADQKRFVEMAETQLMSLHEGNMARYRLRPSEFQVWQRNWNE